MTNSPHTANNMAADVLGTPQDLLFPEQIGITSIGIAMTITMARTKEQLASFSVLLVLCERKPPVTGGFPSQRPVTRSFDVCFVLRLKKQLNKNRDPGDLRSHRAHHDVNIMNYIICLFNPTLDKCWAIYSPYRLVCANAAWLVSGWSRYAYLWFDNIWFVNTISTIKQVALANRSSFRLKHVRFL